MERFHSLSHILLTHNQKLHGFTDLYPRSISFSQFILQNILNRGFGDLNPLLIKAVRTRDVSGYFKDRTQEIADRYEFQVPNNIEELPPVHRSIIITLSTGLLEQ